MLKTVEKDPNAELLQQICDILVAGGYFRARLNIEPFDKVRTTASMSNPFLSVADPRRHVLVDHW